MRAVLDGLFVTPAVAAIGEALAAVEGAIAVVGNAKLATALAKTGREVVAVGTPAPKQAPKSLPDLSSIEAGSLAAVIGSDVASDDGWNRTLADWTRVVRGGGTIIYVDRGRAVEASRRALCAGLTDIEQRRAGRSIVTSGRAPCW